MFWGRCCQDFRVEHSMSVAVFKSHEEKWLSEGSEVARMEEMWGGEG